MSEKFAQNTHSYSSGHEQANKASWAIARMMHPVTLRVRGERLDAGDAKRSRALAGRSSQAGRTVFA